ncbi:MAG: heavy metal translocating P-type ATPase metal-binding domain-containing protein [Methylococcales bacterium]|nr:heavy metal translocating P-type ATPase metal-binding domain-containing protein [Methylococcales bacterium]
MSEVKKACDLCGLPIKIPGFTLKTTVGEKVFCCEGCKAIYQLLNEQPSQAPSDL